MKTVTQREQQVLENISLGYTTKEIASKLYLSSHTIISHKKKLVELGLSDGLYVEVINGLDTTTQIKRRINPENEKKEG